MIYNLFSSLGGGSVVQVAVAKGAELQRSRMLRV